MILLVVLKKYWLTIDIIIHLNKNNNFYKLLISVRNLKKKKALNVLKLSGLFRKLSGTQLFDIQSIK